MSDMFSTFSRLAGLPLPDDDVQAAGDDLRDAEDYADYGFGLPYPPKPENLA